MTRWVMRACRRASPERHRALAWLLGLGVPILAIVIIVAIWGGDLLIPVVVARASAALGRPVSIAHLHISPGRIVTVTADDVTIGNPPDWTGDPLARLLPAAKAVVAGRRQPIGQNGESLPARLTDSAPCPDAFVLVVVAVTESPSVADNCIVPANGTSSRQQP